MELESSFQIKSFDNLLLLLVAAESLAFWRKVSPMAESWARGEKSGDNLARALAAHFTKH
jgi:hypothetical protein